MYIELIMHSLKMLFYCTANIEALKNQWLHTEVSLIYNGKVTHKGATKAHLF